MNSAKYSLYRPSNKVRIGVFLTTSVHKPTRGESIKKSNPFVCERNTIVLVINLFLFQFFFLILIENGLTDKYEGSKGEMFAIQHTKWRFRR